MLAGFLYCFPMLWSLTESGAVMAYLFLFDILGCAFLLTACVSLALGRTMRGRVFLASAILFAGTLPMGQVLVLRVLSAVALVVCILGFLWIRRGRKNLV